VAAEVVVHAVWIAAVGAGGASAFGVRASLGDLPCACGGVSAQCKRHQHKREFQCECKSHSDAGAVAFSYTSTESKCFTIDSGSVTESTGKCESNDIDQAQSSNIAKSES
jgi:hypothetical protein